MNWKTLIFNRFNASFLIFILILVNIFLILYFLISSYKIILAGLGINIEDDCKYKNGKLSCSYVNIKGKNFDISIKNLDINVIFRNIFNDEKVAFLTIYKIDLKLKAQKEKKSNGKLDLKPLKNILYYGYYALEKVDFKLNELNFDLIADKSIKIKNFSIQNKENQFFTLNPFTVFIDKEKIKITNLYGDIDPLTSTINLYSLQIYGYNSELVLNGSYRIDGFVNISGHLQTSKLYIKDITIKDLETFFDFSITPTKRITYSVDLSLGLLEDEKYGVVNNITISSQGKYYKELEAVANASIGSGYVLDKGYIKGISLETAFKLKPNQKYIYSNNNVFIEKIEDNNFIIKNISSSFYLEKEKPIFAAGKFSIDGISGNFESFIKNKKYVKVSTDKFKLSKLINFIKNKPKILDNVNSLIGLKLDVDLNKNTAKTKINLENIDLFGIKFKKGNITADANLKNQTSNFGISLENKNSLVNISGNTDKLDINATLNLKNIDIHNLIFTKSQDLQTNITGKGTITGKLTNPHVNIEGTTDIFRFKQVKLKNVDYKFSYKDFKLVINANTKVGIKSNINISLSPFHMDIVLLGKNANAQIAYDYLQDTLPSLFNYIKPTIFTGSIKLTINPKEFKIDMNIPYAKALLIPIGDTIIANLNGYIGKNSSDLKINFGKENFKFNNITIGKVQGNINLINSDLLINLNANGLNYADTFRFSNTTKIELKNQKITSTSRIITKKDKFSVFSTLNLDGTLSNIKGNIGYVLSFDKNTISKADLKLSLKKEKDISMNISAEKIRFLFNDIYVNVRDIRYNIEISKDINTNLWISNISIQKSKIELVRLAGLLANINKDRVIIYPVLYSGILKGKLENFQFFFKDQNIEFSAKGKMNKDAISELIQLVSIYGDLNYNVYFKGKINKILEKIQITVSSNNLKIRTPYILGYIDIGFIKGKLSDGIFNIKTKGKSSYITFSENSIELFANSDIKNKSFKILFNSMLLPVKFSNLFKGNINSNIIFTYTNEEKKIKGDLQVAGNINLNLSSISGKSKSSSNEKNKELDKIQLDVNISSFIPIYIHGDWGKAYAELKGELSGTALNPIFNGEFNIIYGKINYMKNRFNIDYANIKIINNIPYINARLSTIVANTYIFINITGIAPERLRFDFSSTPPRTKEEIMATLLIRKTPTALENLPIFSSIGKLIKAVLPINKWLGIEETEESRGFLNTGFDISIAPRYTPTEGIVATLYAKKDLTRRLFLALSRPLNQTTVSNINQIGWFEAGLKLTETFSLIGRNYENGINEINIIFNLPFDF